MSNCTDCGHSSFVEVDSFLTCSYCGLVAEARYTLVPDYIPMSFSDYESIHGFKPSSKIDDTISKFEIPLNLSSDNVAEARRLLDDIHGSFKGQSKSLAFTAAAIFYVSQRPISEISEKMGLPAHLICKAVTEVYELQHKKNSQVRNKYASINDTMATNSMLNRLLSKLMFIDNSQSIKIKCATLKFHDYYAKMDAIKPFKDDKLMTTYIYMACEKLRIPEGTMKNVAKACGASVSTIKNIYQTIAGK